jgi:hypothetical protein
LPPSTSRQLFSVRVEIVELASEFSGAATLAEAIKEAELVADCA